MSVGALAAGVSQYHYSDSHSIAMALLTGGLGGLGVILSFPSALLYSKIEGKILEKIAPDSKIFFEELKKNGISVPDRNQKEWLAEILNATSAELVAQDDPSVLELRIAHLSQAIQAAALTLGDSTAEGAALLSLNERLPKLKTFKRMIRPKAWTEQAYIEYLSVRNELARLCTELKLDEKGYSFEEAFQRNLNHAIQAHVGTKIEDVFEGEDVLTNKFIKKGSESILTSQMLNLFRTSESLFRVKIAPKIVIPVNTKTRPVGVASLKFKLTLKSGTPPVEFEVHFPTRIATRDKNALTETEIQALIDEGAWKPHLEAALNQSIESIPEAQPIVAQKVRVAACETQAKPNAETAREVQAELEARELERGSQSSGSRSLYSSD